MSGPDVSVILPVRDGARFVREALESVFAQRDAAELEVIVIDDGSRDDTAGLVAAAFPAVRVLTGGTPEAPVGPAAARNAGLAAARAPLIGFIDHDDLWPEGKIAWQRGMLEADPGLDVVVGLTELATLDGRTVPRTGAIGADGRVFSPALGARLFRASVFERAGAFSEDLWFGEDSDHHMRLHAAGLTVRQEPRPGLIYRLHATNMTRGRDMRELGAFEVLRRNFRRSEGRQP
jgi:glycosyltransferase involved in cell wall biosynthesis